MPNRTERPISCVSALYDARQASKKEKKNILVGTFPRIYVIGNEIKSTKVARFNLTAEFRKNTVKKLFIFFTVLKNDEKK
jgi:hypothetical protein